MDLYPHGEGRRELLKKERPAVLSFDVSQLERSRKGPVPSSCWSVEG